jgi:carboxylesterase type B
VALALNAGRKGNTTLAAKLFAKAIGESDVVAAIQVLEASNAHAHAAQRKLGASKRRLKANDEQLFDELTSSDDMDEGMDEDMELASDMDDVDMDDGMDDGMGEDAPAETMASVLRSMTRRRGR